MIERTKLREERRILRLLAEEVQIKKHLINKILHQHEWHSSQCEPSIDRRRKINVNGMVSIYDQLMMSMLILIHAQNIVIFNFLII